jgi:hypothetical protein
MLRSFTIRSLELDIHHSNHLASWPALSNDWYVYHTALLDQGSSCQPFSKCLSILREFDQRNPQHDVITLFIDLKDPFLQGTSQSAEAFDALIAATLPKVFTPQSLSVHCHEAQTLQASVGPSCPWPLLSELRGSFVVVLTGDFADLQQYVQWNPSTRENLATNRLAFVAPGASSATDLADRPYAVFFNLNGDDADTLSLGELITARGFIARAYDLNEEQAWTVAQQNHIAFLATNEVGPGSAPWAETKNSGGWPFHCMFLDCSALTELLP